LVKRQTAQTVALPKLVSVRELKLLIWSAAQSASRPM
jgi:hypothetical protein